MRSSRDTRTGSGFGVWGFTTSRTEGAPERGQALGFGVSPMTEAKPKGQAKPKESCVNS